jgi:1-deoxy-D-xylulose-5-phosphate synthase
MPNMNIAAPKDEDELQHLLYTAVKTGKPMAVRYPRGQGIGVTLKAEMHLLPVGKWEVLKEGTDLTVIAIGAVVSPALYAVQSLAKEGLDCALINGRFAKPIDFELLTGLSSRKRRLLTVEENVLSGGFGSSILEYLAQSQPHSFKIECISLPDRFIEHGNPAIFRAQYDLDTAGIIRRIKAAFPEVLIEKSVKPLSLPASF